MKARNLKSTVSLMSAPDTRQCPIIAERTGWLNHNELRDLASVTEPTPAAGQQHVSCGSTARVAATSAARSLHVSKLKVPANFGILGRLTPGSRRALSKAIREVRARICRRQALQYHGPNAGKPTLRLSSGLPDTLEAVAFTRAFWQSLSRWDRLMRTDAMLHCYTP